MRKFDDSLTLQDRLKIEIIPGADVDEETAAEAKKFSWTIESATATEIKIQLKFDHPESISVNGKPSIVQVQAKFSDFEPKWIDDLVLVYENIPK